MAVDNIQMGSENAVTIVSVFFFLTLSVDEEDGDEEVRPHAQRGKQAIFIFLLSVFFLVMSERGSQSLCNDARGYITQQRESTLRHSYAQRFSIHCSFTSNKLLHRIGK